MKNTVMVTKGKGFMRFFVRNTILVAAFFCSAKGVAVQTFMPENDLHLADKIEEISNITLDDFNSVIDEAERLYKPLIKSVHGAELQIFRKWLDPTVNANASRSGNRWLVNMYGGLARRPEVTKDGFAIVLCHEIGHHLSGFPFVMSWAGNEGQSDYFSTLSCARELWKEQFDKNAESARTVPAFVKNACDNEWGTTEDKNLCYRVIQAGKSLADLLSRGTARYGANEGPPVAVTVNSHPAGQCRLSTYISGALCDAEFDKNLIPKTERISANYSCLLSRHEVGFRPRCWFKPTL